MKSALFIVIILLSLLCAVTPVFANTPGGGTNGPNVTLVDNGNGTVTMANGIVSILCTEAGATIDEINYTYNNGGGPTTYQMLAGGKNGGQLYWDNGGFGTGNYTYSLVVDPASNGGNYGEISLLSTSASNGTLEIHYSLLRGSTGFYVTVIWSHRNGDAAMGTGDLRENIYLSPTFAWNSIDANRNFQYNVGGAGGGNGTPGQVPVYGAPQEVSVWTNGIAAGHYEDKYKYNAPFGTERTWGWSSVNNPAAGVTGNNIGIWHVLASAEFFNGGPRKAENMDAPMIVSIHGGHYQTGEDSNFATNEVWTHVSGPYFIYCNAVTNTLTNAFQTAQALFTDAQAQAAAEATAWPYSWFTNSNYAPASQRGTVGGQMVIADNGNPNASASNLWVGVVQQPSTDDGVYDFQEWSKPYQFWVQTDANGKFTIPNVIATNNYTLYAFGQGAIGTFMSQNQTGGNPPLLFNLPASPFSVTVTAGVTNNLGAIIWTPSRVGATVFEIGYPDRSARKFRHGDDWWVGDIGPSPTNPMPVWSKFLEYQFDFPSGANYTVGTSRWSTDWNFILPVTTDNSGDYNGATATITFNLATAPANGATASLFLGTASDFYGALIVSINGSNLGSASGVTASPDAIPTSGYIPAYSSSDASIREGIYAAQSDERLTFPASLLHSGANTITFSLRKVGAGSLDDHAMYDYIRLEMTGYVPPPPASVNAYAGNNCNLICWPVAPGATSYNILRSTTSGSGYVSITNGVIGPVCGSGLNNATFLDTGAVNGTAYYYVVRAVNPTGSSTNSPQSSIAIPSAGNSVGAPAAPTGLSIGGVGHHSVTLNWSAPTGANFYTVYRSILVDNFGGASNTLSTIVLNNNTTTTSYTDTSPTDGTIYNYFVTATGAGGTSTNSNSAVGIALPAPPASPPGSLTGDFIYSNAAITLNWSSVPGAIGYIIRSSTSSDGPFVYENNIVPTTYTDGGLNTNSTYYYTVTAVNAAGVSSNATVQVLGVPVAPGLIAIPGNTQVSLNWSSVTGATNYVLQSSTINGGPYMTILVTTNITCINSNLINGTTYYYIVYSQGPNGQSPDSVQDGATPSLSAGGIYWTNTVSASAQSWNVNANWINAAAFPNATQAVAVVNSAIAANQTVNLNQGIIVGTLNLGASGGSFNIAPNSGTLTFDNTPVPATLAELPASKGDTISAPIIMNQSLLVTNPTANTLTLSGNISGAPGGITAGGNLNLNGVNTFTGGIVINPNSTVFPGSVTANSGCWGFGAITLMGGTVQFNGYGGNNGTGWGGCTNTINVPAGQTGTLLLPPRWGYSSPFTSPLIGGGTLNVTVDYVRDNFGGDWSAFTGQINVSVRSSTGDFRIGYTSGYADTTFYLNSGVNFYTINNNDLTVDLGELDGTGGANIAVGNGSATNPTWRIGAKNTTSNYAGVIADAGVTSLIKIGTGGLILTGTNNTYSGGTTVSGGTLFANNPAGSATGSGAVTVANGGTLAGNGIISGAVTVQNGGAFAPGNPMGILTVSNNLTLNSGGTAFARVQHSPFTNDAVKISGTLTQGGTLNVTNTGGALANGDSFKLFSAGTFTGAFSALVLPPLTGNLAWNTNALKTNGVISVVALTAPAISGIQIFGTSFLINGTGGTIDWPYLVLTTTNLSAAQWAPVATNQFDGSGNFSLTITNAVSPDQPQQFYKLQLQ